jgi:tripartite-type tricarboxylate transporter receptor subunit TctC
MEDLMGMRQKIVTMLMVCLALLTIVVGARAGYPDRPIRLIVTSPPGGPPDIMARLITDEMSKALPYVQYRTHTRW